LLGKWDSGRSVQPKDQAALPFSASLHRFHHLLPSLCSWCSSGGWQSQNGHFSFGAFFQRLYSWLLGLPLK